MSSNPIVNTVVATSSIHQSSAGQIPEIIVSQQAVNPTILTTTPGERANQSANETEIRRSHQRFDEYESDDELRREDISFPIDGGKSHYWNNNKVCETFLNETN